MIEYSDFIIALGLTLFGVASCTAIWVKLCREV